MAPCKAQENRHLEHIILFRGNDRVNKQALLTSNFGSHRWCIRRLKNYRKANLSRPGMSQGSPCEIRPLGQGSPGHCRCSKSGRSRVSNGQDILPGIDGRSLLARRYHDIVAQVAADSGGVDRCSERDFSSFDDLLRYACWPRKRKPRWCVVKRSTSPSTRC